METYEPFVSLGLALVAGLLIGVEREQSQRPEHGEDSFLGGVRTHPLFALVGGVSMLLSREIGLVVVALTFAALIAFLAISYADDVRHGRTRGLTSEAAFILAFLLGALAASDEIIAPLQRKVFLVASAAIVATLLLSLKPRLHSVVRRASPEDVLATLKFLVVAVVVLPLLPNETYGPLQVLNPFEIGVFAALIAGISFTGYLAIRMLGPRRGLGVTGLVGGLASSTAVTMTLSGRAREAPSLHASCALAIALASTIMFPRVLVEVALVNAALLRHVALPIGAMGIAGLVVSGWFWHRSGHTERAPDIEFRNPFELSSAIKFAALFAIVLLGARAATEYLGRKGTYLAGVAGGLTDVDAITLSMASLSATGEVAERVAATTIYLGTVSNTVVKAGMATVVGGWVFGRQIAIAFAALIAAGLAGVAVLWLL